MRYFVVTCASFVLAVSIVSVVQWRKLRTDQEVITKLHTKLAEAELGGIGGPPRARVPSPVTLVAETGDITSIRPATATMPTTSTAGTSRPVGHEQEMLNDPEYRKSRLTQLRLMMAQNYPQLVEELRLSPDEADKLWELLAENQLDRSANAIPLVNGQIDPQTAQEVGRTLQEIKRKFEESLAAMLGGAKFQQWQQYQETRPGRLRAMQLGRELELSGQQLNESQLRNLTAALIAEQKPRFVGDPQQPGSTGASDQRNQAQLQLESNRRVIEAAASYLNARQLDALRASLDEQSLSSRTSPKAPF